MESKELATDIFIRACSCGNNCPNCTTTNFKKNNGYGVCEPCRLRTNTLLEFVTAEVERAAQKFAADIQRKVDLEYRAGGRYPGHLIEPWADIVRPIINKAAVPQKDKI